jgi:hypothetical protein
MWRCIYRKGDYLETTEKWNGWAAEALAGGFHRVPGGCRLRDRDERGGV